MKRGEIYIVDLAPTIGHEITKTRPCVIISPDEMNCTLKTVIIAPITSKERCIPTRVKLSDGCGLKEASWVVLDQIRTIDKMRLVNVIGSISSSDAANLRNRLHEMFD